MEGLRISFDEKSKPYTGEDTLPVNVQVVSDDALSVLEGNQAAFCKAVIQITDTIRSNMPESQRYVYAIEEKVYGVLTQAISEAPATIAQERCNFEQVKKSLSKLQNI